MDKNMVINQLKWSVQALALEAKEQVSCFPSFVVVTDELLLEFDNWYNAALANFPDFFSQEQQVVLMKLNAHLDSHSIQDEFKSEIEELEQYTFWAVLRALAKDVLRIMDWEQGIPPRGRAAHIQTI